MIVGGPPQPPMVVPQAMRFDPLAPGLPRQAAENVILARGTRREKAIPGGATVIAAFSSAMMDQFD